MTRGTQTLLLTVTGAVLVRMAVGDTYLRYVNSWMRWPLVACGVLLVALALVDLWSQDDAPADASHAEGSHVPRAAWLLFVPSLVFFLVAPPALGAHFAERAQTAALPAEPSTDISFPELPEGDPVPMLLDELVMRTAYDGGETLEGRRLEITGFVSRGEGDEWFVTQFGMNCCAADATVIRVVASGVESPPVDQWVAVVGTYVEGTGADGRTPPELSVQELDLVDAPSNQYR